MIAKQFLRLCNESQRWLGDVLVFVAGALMPLGFAPLELRIIPFVSVTFFFLLLQNTTPKQAALRGTLFGFGMFGVGVSWVYNSLHDFGSASVFVSALIALALVLIMAAYFSLFAYVYRRWFASIPLLAILLVLPTLWVLLEWLRGWLFTGFPWLVLGYSQVDTWLAGYVPVGGVLLASYICCLVAAAACVVILSNSARERLYAFTLILLLLVSGLFLKTVDWVQSAGEAVSVALVQGAIPQEEKMNPYYLETSLQRYMELTRPHLGKNIIVWPETAIHAFSYQVGPFINQLEQELADSGSELLSGIFIRDFTSNRYYNSVMKIGDKERSTYRKQRLVPFGEYMPFRGLLEFARYYIDVPMSDIAAAESGEPLNLADHLVAMSICYESAYSEVYRQQLPRSSIMANVSNDAWFGDSLAPHQHLEIARVRALEAGRYLLRSTNTGISAIIDSRGQIIARSRQFEEDVVPGEITPLKGETLYIKVGNWLVLLMSVVGIILAMALSGKLNIDQAN